MRSRRSRCRRTGTTLTGRAIRRSACRCSIADVLAASSFRPEGRCPARRLPRDLAVPLMREGHVHWCDRRLPRRAGPSRTSRSQLLETFADQAVIAIENARLFNETTEALERQTATAEILKVISGSPTDTQPVFDAIVMSAARLFGRKAALRTVEGDGLRRRARSYAADDEFHGADLMPIDRDSLVGRAVIECRALQDSDTHAPSATPYARAHSEQLAFRSIASAPLVRDGAAIGVISVSSPDPGALTDKQMALLATFADQAVIAIENARLFKETQDALANQTATADILRVISGSPTSVQPVFDAIVGTAVRLLACDLTVVVLRKGNLQSMVAGATRDGSPIGISPGDVAIDPADNFPARVFATGRMLHLPDWTAIELPDRERRIRAASGMTASLMVPMVREGECIGVLVFGRATPGPFRDAEIALAESFADQALIAIENVRLFNETNEALERQTATAEILRVISGSVTDTQPVFDAIVASCQRLFSGKAVALVFPRGDLLESVAYSDDTGAARGPGMLKPWPLDRGSGAGTCILDSRVVNVADTAESAKEFARMQDLAIALGYKSCLFVPLLREAKAIGCITILRATAGRFDDQEVALAQTFADQAVIAIQNARLFNETKQALERQTATAEVLRVISESPTDVQPVLEAVAQRAGQLCHADGARVWLIADGRLQAMTSYGPAYAAMSGTETLPIARTSIGGRTVLERRPIHVEDVLPLIDDEYPDIRQIQMSYGFRTVLNVPLLREGEAIGAISLLRNQVRPFAPDEIALLQTFADQAVIAIQNVRLFNETNEALASQTASADILRVISSSPTNVQPVFDAIVTTAVKRLGCDIAIVQICKGDTYSPKAMATPAGLTPVPGSTVMPVDPDANFPSRAIVGKTMLHLRDWSEIELPAHEQVRHEQLGLNSTLYLPLLRGDACVGVLVLGNKRANAFNDKAIALAESFRDQAVIAIENVRLFNDTKESLERQTATARILSAMSGSINDARPVFEAIVASCRTLFEDSVVAMRLLRDGVLHVEANIGMDSGPVPLDLNSAVGTCVLEARTIHIPDLQEAVAQFPRTRNMALKQGYRSAIFAPLLRGEGAALGTIGVFRRIASGFSEKDVALLETFADQAVIAIENVRLFNEAQQARAAAESANEAKSSVPRDDEPRDPHADERGHRHERPAPRHAARRRAARLRRHDPRVRRRAAHDHQRHPRLLQDRGGPDGHRGAPVRPARMRRVGARPRRDARGREAPRHRVRVRGRRPGGDLRRRHAAAADHPQPARQRGEVHRSRRGRADRRRPRRSEATRWSSRSPCATPGSGLRRTRWRASSSRSRRPTRRRRASTAAPGWASRSASASPS